MKLRVLLLLFLLSGPVLGQDQTQTDTTASGPYFGGSFGVTFTDATAYGLNLYYGSTNSFGTRGVLSLAFSGDGFVFILSGDAIYSIPLSAVPLRPYLGLGARVGFVPSGGGPSTGGISVPTTLVGLGAIGGAEYQFTPSFGVFTELNLNVALIWGFFPSFAVGVNYHF